MMWPVSEDGAARADRRQRAREAAHDLADGETSPGEIIEAAIETATRVRVTPEIISAACEASGFELAGAAPEALEAAFRAAGFEVEQ